MTRRIDSSKREHGREGVGFTSNRPFLIDISRLVWRFWTGRLPTGIDRVCLAYLDHYGDRAQAVIQRGGYRFILTAGQTDQIFSLLRSGRAASRRRLLWILARTLAMGWTIKARPNSLFLNIGHTGLDEASLPSWVKKHHLRAIYLVHDFIPLTHPQYCRKGEGQKHERRMTNVLRSAEGIIGNSRATLNELELFAAARGLSTPRTIAAWISGPQSRASSNQSRLDTPYFVTLGTIEGRKNHRLLLEIWRSLVRDLGTAAPTLVVIGQRGWEARATFELLDRPEMFSGKLIELSCCPDDELAAWISGARALLMPSFAEGFGLPIIEALGLGCPVIASELPVFREIGGEIPTFADPDDHDRWEKWIRAFVGDHPERSRQVKLMKNYCRPSWPEHFAIVDKWLTRL